MKLCLKKLQGVSRSNISENMALYFLMGHFALSFMTEDFKGLRIGPETSATSVRNEIARPPKRMAREYGYKYGAVMNETLEQKIMRVLNLVSDREKMRNKTLDRKMEKILKALEFVKATVQVKKKL